MAVLSICSSRFHSKSNLFFKCSAIGISPIAALLLSIFSGSKTGHVNPIQFVSATLGGLFLGWIYLKSKNLIYCMTIHLVINLTGFLMLRLVGIERVFEEGFIGLSGGMGNSIGIIIVALLIIAISFNQLNTLFKVEV